jgi:hypothetical protein
MEFIARCLSEWTSTRVCADSDWERAERLIALAKPKATEAEPAKRAREEVAAEEMPAPKTVKAVGDDQAWWDALPEAKRAAMTALEKSYEVRYQDYLNCDAYNSNERFRIAQPKMLAAIEAAKAARTEAMAALRREFPLA